MQFDTLTDIKLKELIEQETGEKFNSKNYIICPFHNEKTASLSVKFYSDANKERFKCFGCDESGDAIDFIMKFKGIDYVKAREYLGLSVEKTEIEIQAEKIQNYIEWELKKYRSGQALLGLFPFVNQDNEIVYFKAKFSVPGGGKELSYYHVEDNKVINKRKGEELPYNLYSVLEGIKDTKIIVVCEGEKDANTVNKLLKGSKYIATSVKSVKDISILKDALIYVCGDTGEAGREYVENIKKQLMECSKAFKIINLPGIEDLGDNKDVTDWIQSGHTKGNLLEAFKRSLDLNSKLELQQDWGGIYKFVTNKQKGEEDEVKTYITNFSVLSASNIKYVDKDVEGVSLTLKSSLGGIVERSGLITVFDDVKSFKNFLNSMELVFNGNIGDLNRLKIWIKKYFVMNEEKVYNGVKFIYEDGGAKLITPQGTLSSDGKFDKNTMSDGGTGINIIEVNLITREELQELKGYLFNFTELSKSYSIIGTIIHNFAVAQAIEANVKLHHLLIAGESGSGKSTILKNVIAPILNYPEGGIESIGLNTFFALIKALSEGNYTMLYDEYKPATFDKNKSNKLSDILRNLYDRTVTARGNKKVDGKAHRFLLCRPVVISGEESYSNNEGALIQRTCIVYLSRAERTEKHTATMKWIGNNLVLLNKLGRSLIDEVLNLSIEEYREIREKESKKLIGLKDRPYQTAINICCGIEILNKLLKRHGLEGISDYEPLISANIVVEVLEENEEVLSQVEQMLILYNDMIEDGRTRYHESVIQRKDGQVYIRTSEMLNQINEHVKNVGIDILKLNIKDFRKQGKKSGYLINTRDKQIKILGTPKWFDKYNANKLKKLGVSAIVPPDFQEEEWLPGEENLVFPNFSKGATQDVNTSEFNNMGSGECPF